MTLKGAAAAARLARENGLAFAGMEIASGSGELVLWADGTRVDDEEQAPDTGLPELDAVLSGSRAIVVRPGCRRYEIRFTSVVMHAHYDEGLHVPEDHEDFSTPLRRYTDSRFLRFLKDETLADKLLDEPLLHYRIAMLNDIIDVAATTPPDVLSRVLTVSDLWMMDD
ncbi:hypothetical protein [Primorskyibacter sp. S187A]|uniref:hypothetical protein n=1 Tax=Primorskyibacter sp. S187A TaxID=3415130 RepID=UPI003C7C0E63